MTPHDFSYADLLARNAQVHGDAPALIDGGALITHRHLYRSSQALARWLAGQGLVTGDRVAVLASNRVRFLALLGASATLGLTLVLLNTRASAGEIADLVNDSAPRLLFCEDAFLPLLAQVPEAVVCHHFGSGVGRLKAWPQTAVDEAGDATPDSPDSSLYPISPRLPWVAIPTAAVLGRPRLALVSQTALLHQAMQLAHLWRLDVDTRHLCVLPLFHVAGLGMTLASQISGGASVLMARFDATDAVQLIEGQQVTCFTSFAPILGAILDQAQAQGASLGALRTVIGLEAEETVARLHRQCPEARFWSGYGQTETGGLVSLAPFEEGGGFAGYPLPTVALRIETAEGLPAPVGEQGEIVLRSPGVFEGYWGEAPATAHVARGGWHHTGDLGRLDAQGRLWFLGRAPEKALIKSGGENIYPSEVEQALLDHPSVTAAVVFGVPDSRWGEAVRAVCVLRPGAAVAADELIEHVAQRIARFKKPREVVLVPALPRRADGTWDREAIAAAHAA